MIHKCQFCNEICQTREALRMHIRLKHRDKVSLATLEHPLASKPKEKPSNK